MGKNTQKERKYLKASPNLDLFALNQMEIFLRISLRFVWCLKFLGVDLVFLLSAGIEWSDLLPRMPKDTSFGKPQSRTSLQTPVCHHHHHHHHQQLSALGLDIPELPSICPGSWGEPSSDHIIGSSFRSCGRLEWVCQQEKLFVGTSTHHF